MRYNPICVEGSVCDNAPCNRPDDRVAANVVALGKFKLMMEAKDMAVIGCVLF
jgi:hypothetical protein